MGRTITKIKYEEEGPPWYGSVVERTLYCEYNRSCDCGAVYDDKGQCLFEWDELSDKDLRTQLVKLLTENHETCDEIEICFDDEFEKVTGRS